MVADTDAQPGRAVAQPEAYRVGKAIRDARQAIDRLEAEHLTDRLDRLQQPSPSRSLGRDLGISL